MPLSAPYRPPGTLTNREAGTIDRRARRLLESGDITAKTYAILCILLWDDRAGRDRRPAAYTWIQKRAHCCRQTAVSAIASLIKHGLLRKHKQRDLLLWHNGGRKWRQQPNVYELVCESHDQTEYNTERTRILSIGASAAENRVAQEALADVARQRAARLQERWLTRRSG